VPAPVGVPAPPRRARSSPRACPPPPGRPSALGCHSERPGEGAGGSVRPLRWLRGFVRELDRLVAATPPHRDRYVDFLRVVAIGVVVLWHWSLSVLSWSGGRWVMPNPIHHVPGSWLAT